jgi:ketosteroid isomerase-like protein
LTVVIAAALAMSSAELVGHAQTKPAAGTDRTATEKLLAANENKVNQAYISGDVATMKAMIADDAFAVDMNGPSPISEMFKMLATVKIQMTGMTLTNMKFIWADDNTVVLTYTWSGKGTANAQPIPSPTYASTVWSKRTGKWIAVFHQETTAAPPPPIKK